MAKKKRHITRKLIILLVLLALIFIALCFVTPTQEEMSLNAAAGEIADITGKTLRVIQYNQQKLKAEGRITSHGPGRLSDNTVREKRPVLIQLYTDSYDYLMEKFGNVTNVVNDLVDKYRKELEESDKG